MSRKTTIMIIALLSLAFTFGIFAGLNIAGARNGSSQAAGADTFKAGWNAAKERLADSGFYPMIAASQDVKTVRGEVKTIKDGKLLVSIRPLEPLADPKLDQRIVTIDNSTKIYLMTPKSPELIREEMDEYNKQMAAQMKTVVTPTGTITTPPAALAFPEMYVRTETALSELKAGQQVTVISETNIFQAKEFKASEINAEAVIAPAAMPAPVPAALDSAPAPVNPPAAQ